MITASCRPMRADPVRGRRLRHQFRLCSGLSRGAVSLDARLRQHRLSARAEKRAAGRRRTRTERLVAHLGVKLDLTLYPYQMSGGQRQLSRSCARWWSSRNSSFSTSRSALDYGVTLFMREQLPQTSGDRHHHDPGVARSGRSGTSRPTACCCCHDMRRGVRLVPVATTRPRTDATLSEPIRAHQGRVPDDLPARGATLMNPDKADALLRGSGSRPRHDLVAGDMAAMGRSGPAASPIATSTRSRASWRDARVRFSEDRLPHGGIDRSPR